MSRPWAMLAACLLLTLGLGSQLPSLRIDNTPEAWLNSKSEALRELRTFRARFGEDTPLIAYVSGENLAAKAPLWQALVAEMSALPGVARVFAPQWDGQADAAGQDATQDSPQPLRYYLSSPDGRHAALVLLPQESLQGPERNALVDRLENALAPWKSRLGEFHLAGPDVITHDLDSGSQSSLSSLAPLVLFAMCLVLYFASREWRAVVVSLLAILMLSVWCMALLPLSGRSLNLVVATMPAILAVVLMTQSMHVLAAFHALPAPESPTEHTQRMQWWRQALRTTFRPNLLCVLTTAAGFASLGSSQIPPVRDLGILTAIGVCLSFVLSYTLIPALLAADSHILPRGLDAQPWWTRSKAEAYTDWLSRRSTLIFAVAVITLISALGGMRLLRVESHILELFSPDHRVPVNYRMIEKNLLALTPIELVIDGSPSVLVGNDSLEAYRSLLSRTLADEAEVHQIVSILLEPTRSRKLEFALSPSELREALADDALPAGLDSYFKIEQGRYFLRTTLLVATNSSDQCYALVERLRARLRGALPPGVNALVTGSATELIEGQVQLVQTQIWSFGLAFAMIAIVILISFRSLSFALVTLPPNLVPISFTLGFMGFSGIPLNTATVTVAGIALGLVMDDTIHVLHYWIRARRAGSSSYEAVTRALLEVGHPALMTSLAVGVGFGVFAFAPFRPTKYFGLLIAITAVTGLLCDLVLFPAMLLMADRRKTRKQ